MIISPLEQFDVISLISLFIIFDNIFFIDISFFNILFRLLF
jgi:hypothetical protein